MAACLDEGQKDDVHSEIMRQERLAKQGIRLMESLVREHALDAIILEQSRTNATRQIQALEKLEEMLRAFHPCPKIT